MGSPPSPLEETGLLELKPEGAEAKLSAEVFAYNHEDVCGSPKNLYKSHTWECLLIPVFLRVEEAAIGESPHVGGPNWPNGKRAESLPQSR